MSGLRREDTARDLSREVRRLALPAILHSCLQTLVFVVDRVMLGRVGQTELAAMQVAGTLEWSLVSVLLAFEVGVVARVGFYVGARRLSDARSAALAGLGLAVLFGSVIALATPVVLGQVAWLAPTASAATLRSATDYLSVTLPASPIVFMAATAVAILQAGGDTKRPLYVALFANVIHLPLNRILILGAFGVPAMGARGCGISTAVTFAIELFLLGVVLFSRRGATSLAATSALERASARPMVREIMAVSWPSMIEKVLYHVGFLGFVTMIGRLGDRVMAANQIMISVEAICFLSADGFGIAAAALVAQKLGAGKPEASRMAAVSAARDAALVLALLGLAVYLLRGHIGQVFVQGEDIGELVGAAAFVLMVAQPFMAVAIVLAQSLRGAGKTREVLFVTAVSATVIRLAATYLFAFRLGGGLEGVWWGSTTDWALRAVALVLVFRATFSRLAAPEGAPARS